MIAALSLSAAPCFGEGVEVGKATPAQKTAAGAAYKRGLNLFNAKKFEEALEAFHASYDLVKSPNPHLMIGRTLSELDRYGEARAELEATRVEAEHALKADRKYEATVQATQAEIDALLQKTARIEIELAGTDGTVSIDGAELSSNDRAESVLVKPGTRNVVLVTTGGERVERQVNAEAGKLVHVVLEPPPKPAPATPAPAPAEPESGHGKRTTAYVFGGVGIASLATFGVFALKSSSEYSDLEDACAGQRCPADKRDLAVTGKRDQSIANAALFVGVFALGTGAVLLWQSTSEHAESERGVSLRAGAASLRMDGRF